MNKYYMGFSLAPDIILERKRMLIRESGQLDFHSKLIEELIRKNHPYRRIIEIIKFLKLLIPIHKLYSRNKAS